MDTYYLIDFENVSSTGLTGCDSLGGNDYIIIFYTSNSKNLNLNVIKNINVSLTAKEIAAGKQSVDNHIASYIGYLVGKFDKECTIVVISKDTGYDKLIKFWKDLSGVSIIRKSQVKSKSEGKSKSNSAEQKAANLGNADINEIVQKALCDVHMQNDIITCVNLLVTKHFNDKKAKQKVYTGIVSKYGQTKGREIYNVIRKYL